MNEIIVTSNGKLSPFNYTIDFSKSIIPLMPEAVEAKETIAGADGEIVFNTTYGARVFELVALTDDGLSPAEKETEKDRVKAFLHSIKNQNIKLKFEQSNRVYEVKYNGLAEANNMPMCVEFVLPLKSSQSYAKSITTYEHAGNGDFTSDTIEPAGCKIIIEGPASLPIFVLNGQTLNYNNTVASGHTLVIDTSNSTVTDYNSQDVGTNVISYFNHIFPKIQNGTNTVSISSGVDPENFTIKWNDLLL